QLGRIDPEPPHARADFGPLLLEEAVALGIAEARPCAWRDEHADAALDHDQPLVLESLIGLGDGQRIGLLLGGEGADGGKRIAIAVRAGEDRVGDRLAEANVDGLLMLAAERHAVIIHRCAGSSTTKIKQLAASTSERPPKASAAAVPRADEPAGR